jgi:radical SAM superfamily enzyme YgiQ (UPF0313 family)
MKEREFTIALISLYVFENNGVRFLAGQLRREGFTVYEIYFKDYLHHRFIPPTETEWGLLLDFLVEKQVRLVGISLRAGAYKDVAIEMTRRIRERLDCVITWGGAHVTLAMEECLDHADFVLRGESEEALVEVARTLLQGGEISGIRNLAMKRDGRVIANPLRPLVEDLDRLAFRDYHSHEFKRVIDGDKMTTGEPCLRETIYLMISSRGCVYNCSFCDVNVFRKRYAGLGKFFRVRSVENCLQELEYARRTFPKLVKIRFDDELFAVDRSWLLEFAEKYPRRIGLPFEILSDPRAIEEEAMRLLRGAGLDRVLMGIQANARINRELYNRPCPDRKVLAVARLLHHLGIKATYQIIVDDPFSTEEDRRSLLELLLQFPRPYELLSFSIGYWPGTDLTERMLAEGWITPDQVEGRSKKVLEQFRVDLSYPRPPEDTLYVALLHMVNKRFVPRELIRRLYRSERFRRNPRPVVWLSNAVNFVKMGTTAWQMFRDGELTWNMVKRWANFRSPASV